VHHLSELYPGICLTTEEKARENLSQGSLRVPAGTMKIHKHTIRIHRHNNENVEKYCRAGLATDDNMAHAHCMLDNEGYEQTLRLSYIVRTLSVLLYSYYMEHITRTTVAAPVCSAIAHACERFIRLPVSDNNNAGFVNCSLSVFLTFNFLKVRNRYQRVRQEA
jgi:hypothetical protein